MISVNKSASRVRQMFAEIAPRYDLMNHVLSLGIDICWRRRVVRELNISPGLPILDCCTGTGDLALMLASSTGGAVEVIGTDFCLPMLQLAKQKHAAHYASLPVKFVEADTQLLPFGDSAFQAVTVAFGLRNVENTQLGLREMTRVCAPGGRIAVLEFSQPTLPGLRQIYQGYFKYVLPRIGQVVARNKSDAYEYLPNSVEQFPSGEGLAKLMRESGIGEVRIIPLTLGIASLYLGNVTPGAS